MRQAYRFRTESLFDTSFPWFSHTIIEDWGVSLWYGFSILLIPFTFFSDLTLGIKIAGVVFTTFALFIYYWIAKKEHLRWSFVWPLVILGATPNTMFRLLMVRMQILTVPLSALLLWFLVRGYTWASFVASFLIVWIHGNFAWVPFLLLGTAQGVAFIFERRFLWREGLAVMGGFLAGWLLRPHPFSAARVFYTQIVEHSLVKKAGLPLLFGAEHFPLSFAVFTRNFLWFAIVEAVALIFFIWLSKQEKITNIDTRKTKTFIAGFFAVSLGFFILTMLFSRRAYDFWVVCGVLAIGGTLSYGWEKIRKGKIRNVVLVVGAIMILVMGVRSIVKTKASLDTAGYPPRGEAEVSKWLAEHSKEGNVVFNIHWPLSSRLFFWNQKNYYVGGFDPIFEYAEDRSLYWKHHYIAEDQEIILLGKTCRAVECRGDELENIYPFIREELGAKFVLVETKRNPRAFQYFSSDKRFEKVFENGDSVVFKVKTGV